MNITNKNNGWKWLIVGVIVILISSYAIITHLNIGADLKGTKILSKNRIDYNNDSQNEELDVVMVEGKHYENTEPGPYMGENWEGKYTIQLIDMKGNMLSELDLNQAFNEEALNFQQPFEIEFEDYNNDGALDFAIGQYGSSNGNSYRLFTVSTNGEINILPIKGQTELFSSGGNRYSKIFEKTDIASFKNQYYDNKLGRTVEEYYTWSENENQFILNSIEKDVTQKESQDNGKIPAFNGTVTEIDGTQELKISDEKWDEAKKTFEEEHGVREVVQQLQQAQFTSQEMWKGTLSNRDFEVVVYQNNPFQVLVSKYGEEERVTLFQEFYYHPWVFYGDSIRFQLITKGVGTSYDIIPGEFRTDKNEIEVFDKVTHDLWQLKEKNELTVGDEIQVGENKAQFLGGYSLMIQ